ncbi:hypothetical protein BLNAU_23067 [Blattamonas nauphoetae]|uniref:Uncharacterized protein n=1 Tax=Blattamonas nauphoetae TaxID=2049346 RepID=A0ABQ9WRS8_9EUKA|nr:hypothetical protein BLNAU_23067 [Blattamonas nauphoetae]
MAQGIGNFLQPAFDDSLEAKAVKFLESVDLQDIESAETFLRNFASKSGDCSTEFVQSFVGLLSSASRVITTAAMKLLKSLLFWCSPKVSLALRKADLIPQLINNLNPLSLSFAEAADIHIYLLTTIHWSFWLATPNGLARLDIEDGHEKQAVHETVLTKLLIPSEQYICHFCVHRFSIVDGDQSVLFLEVLATVLRICPYYPPTMEFVLHMPVFLTIPISETFLLLVLRFVCGSERARQLRMKKQKDCGWDEPTQTPSALTHHRFLVKVINALWRHRIGPAGSARSRIVGEDLLPHSQCFPTPSSTQQNTICLWELRVNNWRAGKKLVEQGGWSEDETEQDRQLLSSCSTIVERLDTPHSFSAHHTRRLLFSTLPSCFIASPALNADDTRFSIPTNNTTPAKHICEWADIDSIFGERMRIFEEDMTGLHFVVF